jgi:hypothetical protein
MNLRIDRFTWVVIAVVVALLVAAIITVNRNAPPDAPAEYRTDDSPETPVFNAFLALQRGDIGTAREQYSERILNDHEENYDPFVGRGYVNDSSARRLRVLSTEIDSEDADKALVIIAIDSYYPGGLFGGNNTSTMQRTLQVIREDGQWKLDTDEYFY